MSLLNAKSRFCYWILAVVSLVCATSVNAESYLIKQATVHTATAKGTLHNTDILIENGKITQVGSELTATDGAQIIQANGKHVTPGLINAETHMGLLEIEAVASTVDTATTFAGIGASLDISTAINMRSTLIPQNRINGLTRAIVQPSSEEKLFMGQGAAIVLHSSMRGIAKERVAQFASFGDVGAIKAGGSRAAALQLLHQALSEAKYLRQHEAQYRPGYHWEFSQSLMDLKSLYRVLDREIPLVVSANRSDDISRLVSLAKKHQIKLVISGAAEAWVVAAELADADIPVIIDPMQNLPQFESLAIRLDGAAKLHQAGVKLLFTGGGSHNAYLVRQSAGNAVANGLAPNVAIEAMTINTAEVFSIRDYGQIKPGMDADIVVWDGDPLEVTSNADVVLIQGEKQMMVSRATRLRDRYWDLSDSTNTALRR
jgi:imidazolonepropionase-like amidohydrolase